tara:strand:+ start:1709 stop:1906 length:198 start_codon:yes stop_codon:yes gene_type:complete
MKLDENFLSNFLRKVRDGVIDSAGKKMLKDNPELAKKTKEFDKINREYEDYLDKLAKKYGMKGVK